MGLVSLNLKPSQKQLHDFGDIALFMSNFIGLLLVWLAGLKISTFFLFCSLGMVVYLLSRISTRLVRPIYLGLNLVSFPIGWILSHIVLALFYFGIITGVGLVFKLFRRDPLHQEYDIKAESYWTPCRRKRPAEDYFRQY